MPLIFVIMLIVGFASPALAGKMKPAAGVTPKLPTVGLQQQGQKPPPQMKVGVPKAFAQPVTGQGTKPTGGHAAPATINGTTARKKR